MHPRLLSGLVPRHPSDVLTQQGEQRRQADIQDEHGELVPQRMDD